jgi:hypothetical protein
VSCRNSTCPSVGASGCTRPTIDPGRPAALPDWCRAFCEKRSRRTPPATCDGRFADAVGLRTLRSGAAVIHVLHRVVNISGSVMYCTITVNSAFRAALLFNDLRVSAHRVLQLNMSARLYL